MHRGGARPAPGTGLPRSARPPCGTAQRPSPVLLVPPWFLRPRPPAAWRGLGAAAAGVCPGFPGSAAHRRLAPTPARGAPAEPADKERQLAQPSDTPSPTRAWGKGRDSPSLVGPRCPSLPPPIPTGQGPAFPHGTPSSLPPQRVPGLAEARGCRCRCPGASLLGAGSGLGPRGCQEDAQQLGGGSRMERESGCGGGGCRPHRDGLEKRVWIFFCWELQDWK